MVFVCHCADMMEIAERERQQRTSGVLWLVSDRRLGYERGPTAATTHRPSCTVFFVRHARLGDWQWITGHSIKQGQIIVSVNRNSAGWSFMTKRVEGRSHGSRRWETTLSCSWAGCTDGCERWFGFRTCKGSWKKNDGWVCAFDRFRLHVRFMWFLWALAGCMRHMRTSEWTAWRHWCACVVVFSASLWSSRAVDTWLHAALSEMISASVGC